MTSHWPMELLRLIIEYLPIELQMLILGNGSIKLEVSFNKNCFIQEHQEALLRTTIYINHLTISYVALHYQAISSDLLMHYKLSPSDSLFEHIDKNTKSACWCRTQLLKQQLVCILKQKISQTPITFSGC
jgi:hypothetical protein